MAALLDVNVLISLFDPDHLHHEPAHTWLAANRGNGWATCPLTENGAVRILSNPGYSNVEERPCEIASRLNTFRNSGDHSFWSDDASLCDRGLFRLEQVAGYRQLTDVYLLALATVRGEQLATFDRTIPSDAVVDGREHLVVIAA